MTLALNGWGVAGLVALLFLVALLLWEVLSDGRWF